MLLAGVHPLSWLPVGAISYRADLLAPLFLFLALGGYAGVRGRSRWSWRHAALAASTAAAVLSKETALVWVPATLLAWEVRCLFASTGAAQDHRGSRRAWAVTGLVLLGYALARSVAAPGGWRPETAPLSAAEAVGTRLAALGRQVEHLVDPTVPSLSDAMEITALSAGVVVGGAALASLIVGAVRWRGTDAGWICAFLAIALAPSLNPVPLPRFTSPHYGYLAAFGAAMAVAAAPRRLGAGTAGRVAWVAVAAWAAAASSSTSAGGSRFADDERLFRPAVAEDDRFLEGHHYLGEPARRAGDRARADAHLTAALRFRDDTLAYVDWVAASVSLAGVRLEQSRLDEAEELLERAESGATPQARDEIVYNRALVAARRGDDRRVVALLEPEAWDRPEPVLLLARSLAALGRRRDAVTELRRALPMLDEAQRRRIVGMIHSLQQEDEP
jgi:tetratricopeptide (TPR) repeat protein